MKLTFECSHHLQFMNKVLYAREGARSIMDRTFEDFPWQVRVEVDGVDIEVPEVSTENYLTERKKPLDN